jgi:hypothetical protein
MFNKNPDKEDYAETATAGGGAAGAASNAAASVRDFPPQSAAAVDAVNPSTPTTCGGGGGAAQSPRKSRTEYLCTQTSTAKTTRHRPPPPRRGGGSWAAGRPQQHALEDRILQHLFQQVHIGGGPRVPRAQEVRAWKATRVEAHAIHQGGQWFSTPALGREAPCPAGVVMLLLERAPKAAARVGRARPAAPATPRVGTVRTRT